MKSYRRWFAGCVLLLMGHGVWGQVAGTRGRISLSGMWDFRMDAAQVGEAQRWFEPQAAGAWTKLAVPGSFNESTHGSIAERMAKGSGWYRTTFATPTRCAAKGRQDRCVLHLDGTVLRHAVWVNGQLAGRSERPYLAEEYDLTDKLAREGTNTVVVEVNNLIAHEGVPDQNWHGWWDDGGLIRPVYLEIRPHVVGETLVTTTMAGRGWRLGVHTDVAALATGADAVVGHRLLDNDARVVWIDRAQRLHGTGLAAGAEQTVMLRNIAAWSPDHPVLYTLTTTVSSGGKTDTTRVRVGFRQIQVQGTRLLLNGRPLLIRGVSRHQFLAGAGMSLSDAQNRRDLVDIKALGANFVRLAHYTQSQDVYDACDELGLLVWTEIPAWQSSTESLSSEAVWHDLAEPQLRGMVMQHRNHPSVVMWSVANEIPSDKPEGSAYVRRAIAAVKALDSSRLITFASDRRLTDTAFQQVDVIAINEYFGWYYGQQSDVGEMLDEMHRLFPAKPILVSEFGADAVAGWSREGAAADSRDYSYASQVSFLKTHMEQIFSPARSGFVAGGLVWVYNDFPDPNRIGGDHPVLANYRNNKGLVTEDRVHKPSYDAVQHFYQGLHDPEPGR